MCGSFDRTVWRARTARIARHGSRSHAAEALALAEDRNAGAAWLDGIRARYPRRYAFRGEINPAARESPYLPAPAGKRRP